MTETSEKVEHPEWCDRSLCVAPEFRPTSEQYKNGAKMGEHRSAPRVLPGIGPGRELNVWLSQAVAPWGTGTFLRMGTGDNELWWSTEIGEGGEGFALYALLGSAVGGLVKEFPTLYAERFPWLADTEAAAADEEWETLPGVTDTYPSTSVDDNAQHVDEPPCGKCGAPESAHVAWASGHAYVESEFADEESDRYQLAVNDSAKAHGTLREVRAAVAELITSSLADDPDGVAADAQMVNMAFTGGAVQAALDERGEWFTLFGVHGKHAALRIKVTREA
jgi:hypothetical protein